MKSIPRPKSLTELVTEKLREIIVNGELGLGEQVSEVKLAKELDVSRTPVREAFNRLEIDGLLKVEPRRGTFVFSLEPHEISQLCEARVCLETKALELGIRTNSEDLHQKLAGCVEAMQEALEREDISAYLTLDTVFHQCLFDCSRNRFLDDAYQAIAQKMAAIRSRIGHHPDHIRKSFHEHNKITEAVASKDMDAAMKILLNHIDLIEGSYWNMAALANTQTAKPAST
ncbi:GntR family transcriptional regulator [Cohaesibacter celericrescens]|nr:GntR family transcriptional regulator [Cohaesibacter celericrescens]